MGQAVDEDVLEVGGNGGGEEWLMELGYVRHSLNMSTAQLLGIDVHRHYLSTEILKIAHYTNTSN